MRLVVEVLVVRWWRCHLRVCVCVCVRVCVSVCRCGFTWFFERSQEAMVKGSQISVVVVVVVVIMEVTVSGASLSCPTSPAFPQLLPASHPPTPSVQREKGNWIVDARILKNIPIRKSCHPSIDRSPWLLPFQRGSLVRFDRAKGRPAKGSGRNTWAAAEWFHVPQRPPPRPSYFLVLCWWWSSS